MRKIILASITCTVGIVIFCSQSCKKMKHFDHVSMLMNNPANSWETVNPNM